MNIKTKTRVKYAVCIVLTAAVTAAAMLLPQVYYSLSDGSGDPGSVTETFDLSADAAGLTTSEFITLAGAADTVWVRNYNVQKNYEMLAQAVGVFADSLKANSDGYVSVETAAALISDVSAQIGVLADGNVLEYGLYSGYKMKGTLDGKSVENSFVYTSLVLQNEGGGYNDTIQFLYDENNNMIYEFTLTRIITDAKLHAEYMSEYYPDTLLLDDTDANPLIAAAEKYWQLASDDNTTTAYIESGDYSDNEGYATVCLCAGQSFSNYCPDMDYESQYDAEE